MSNENCGDELRKMNQVGRLMNRGMTKQEEETLLTAPMNDRERAFYRCIYETFLRVNELLQCNIEDYNKTIKTTLQKKYRRVKIDVERESQ